MRLIDADELIEKATKDGAYGYVSAEEIYDIPTAYDVEAVVRELQEANFVVYERTSKGLSGLRSVRLIDAIAIVKRGGRNDKV